MRKRQGTTVAARAGSHAADPDRSPGALAAYGLQALEPTDHRRGRGRHVRRPARRAVLVAAVGALVLGAASSTALQWHDEDAGPRTSPSPVRLPEVRSEGASGTLVPGGSLTGTVLLTNRQARAVEVADVRFAAPTSDACTLTGVSLAPTLPPTRESPLQVPAGGTETVAWTAFMDGTSEQACQGATLTSAVLLDGAQAGTVDLTAGTLEPPPAPAGGLTTSTRAAVRWSPSTAADPGWVVERAVAGTDDWRPACGSSAARPVRALGCTDTGLTRSTDYAYRVTVRTGHWHMTSRPSAPVRTQARPSA